MQLHVLFKKLIKMNNKGLVSIVIPCYNQSQYLAETFISLNEQSYKNWECIVVDDGSTDNSVEIVEKFSNNDSRIRLVKKENGGTASARNLGLQGARGEYIQFLDADDKLDKNKIQKQLSFMSLRNLDVSYTNFVPFFENEAGEIIEKKMNCWMVTMLFSLRFSLLLRWGVDFSIPIHCWMYRMDFLRKNNLYFNSKIRFREDWNFHLNVSRLIKQDVSLPNYLGAYYRMNPTGKTSSYLKIIDGNIRYISLKWKEMGLFDNILWCYRMSLENWQTVLRCLKHKELKGFVSYRYMFENMGSIFLLMSSFILLPFSFVHIFIRAIRTYL